MNYDVAKECTLLSDAEKIAFPEVVRRLLEAGIELYYADLLSSTKTYYTGSVSYTVPSQHKNENAVNPMFNAVDVIKAIRQSQAGEIHYQEFLKKIMQAGVISYMVFLTGRKAIYFGRKGEQHIEEFPQ